MEDESWKEERRKRAEERIRSVEAAQARIDALIARAGGPVMVCRNVQESEKDKHEDTIQALFDIGDYKNGGDLTVWIRELTDTIDRLEAALYNTLNERDQLLKDLLGMVTNTYGCDACTGYACEFCSHKDKSDGKCKVCYPENEHWEWRGVPEEVADDDASRSD